MSEFKRTWAEIDLSAIGENLNTVRRRVGTEVQVMAVVKANAYGHGVAEVAPFLARSGADQFGVSCLQEAIELRRLGITQPILILGYTPAAETDALLEWGLDQTVFTYEDAEVMSAVSAAVGKKLRLHAALDTGMGRIGFDGFAPESAAAEIAAVAALQGIELVGLFTHFSVADTNGEESYTAAQAERFSAVRRLLAERGIKPICHAANSAAVFLDQGYHFDMVRAGIVLYGLEPGGRENPYRPAMTVKTTVSFVKDLPAGRDISYGRRYTTDRPCRVATLSCGYADGYPRSLSNRGYALIHGKRAPILGTVCMDQMMVDVTEIPCKAGDEAILMGGGIDWNELAQAVGTIHYELVCGVGKRVSREAKE
ncbi:MAG: alanine racemase [Clostridia bacterium]|nr:alanine racemase [Clostridia bacterium]